MRKYILPSALVLVLASVLAVAQTSYRALQLSQDTTGAFAVDSFYGVTFPGHIISNNGSLRAGPSISGTGTPTVSGTDTAGLITMGTSSTTATLLFGTAYAQVPSCSVDWQSNITSMQYGVTTTGILITQSSVSGDLINYICIGNKG